MSSLTKSEILKKEERADLILYIIILEFGVFCGLSGSWMQLIITPLLFTIGYYLSNIIKWIKKNMKEVLSKQSHLF